jgi:hypothetical protein
MDANARRPPTSISRRSRDARAAAELLTGDEARRHRSTFWHRMNRSILASIHGTPRLQTCELS